MIYAQPNSTKATRKRESLTHSTPRHCPAMQEMTPTHKVSVTATKSTAQHNTQLTRRNGKHTKRNAQTHSNNRLTNTITTPLALYIHYTHTHKHSHTPHMPTQAYTTKRRGKVDLSRKITHITSYYHVLSYPTVSLRHQYPHTHTTTLSIEPLSTRRAAPLHLSTPGRPAWAAASVCQVQGSSPSQWAVRRRWCCRWCRSSRW